MIGRGSAWRLSNERLYLRNEVGEVFSFIKSKSQSDYAFFACAANVGLRISEILHIRSENVRSQELEVVRRKKKVLRSEPILLHSAIATILVRLANEVGDGWLWPGRSHGCWRERRKEGQIVGKEQICEGGHVSKREMQRRWTEYVDELHLGRRGRGAHGLRHFAITEFYRMHKDLRAAQEFAGHSSSAITERYAHVIDMADKINKVKPVL